MREPTQNELSDFVNRNVIYCVSGLVYTLMQGYGAGIRFDNKGGAADLGALFEQAAELSFPIPDYEEAATEAGWTGPHKDEFGATYFQDSKDDQTWACASWEELCAEFDIEPYDREVYEHWIVDKWLAEKLEAKGEKVDYDLAGLVIWARTCTGQAIMLDDVIRQIWLDVHKPAEAVETV